VNKKHCSSHNTGSREVLAENFAEGYKKQGTTLQYWELPKFSSKTTVRRSESEHEIASKAQILAAYSISHCDNKSVIKNLNSMQQSPS
jgi:hypothetical protein